MADETVTEKQHPFESEVNETNKTRTGKGTRLKFGMTRGKGSLPIKWESFDESKPDTLPTSMKEFMELTEVKSEADILGFLIVGYNDAQYSAASDPVAEYLNPEWDDDRKSQFRLTVRNLSKSSGLTIDEVVAMIKPAVERAFQASKSAK